MKSLVVNYRVFNDKICDKDIILLTDLHGFHFKKNKDIIDNINNEKSDIIIISGDVLHSSKYIGDSRSKKELEYFFSAISEESPVFIGLGNHDLFGSNEDAKIGYKSLEKARNGKVFPLFNESVVHDGIRITEFHSKHDTYAPAVQENGLGVLGFDEDFNDSNIVIPYNDQLYNILICHNPKHFEQARCISKHLSFDINQEQFTRLLALSKKMSSFDLCLSGHLHNGYIPLSLTTKNPSKYMDKGYWEMPIEKDINGSVKYIRPWIFKNTDLCRGTVFIGETEHRIIELCDGSYYYIYNSSKDPVKISEEQAIDIKKMYNLTPIVISGGVNKYFNLPIDNAEITKIKLLKK